MHVVYSRGTHFASFVVAVLGLAGHRGKLLSKDGKDSIGGNAGLVRA